MSEKEDKTQPGLTVEAHDRLEVITERGGFNQMQDAYRLAVAVALAEELEPADPAAKRDTYANIGGLDPDHSLRAAVLAIREDHDDRPVAFIERLAEAGIAKIYEHLESGKSLREMLARYEPQVESGVDAA